MHVKLTTTPWSALIFGEWIYKLDLDMRKQGLHILLLLDNFSGHKWDSTRITNIRIKLLPPNMKSHIQPCDAGIIRTLKAHFRRFQMEHALDRWEDNQDKIYYMSVLDGMCMLARAWKQVKQSTIRNCWRHTRILRQDATNLATPIPLLSPHLPPSVFDPADQQAIAAAQGALITLYTHTHVDLRSRLTMKDLLKLTGEDGAGGEVEMPTDESIVVAVRGEVEGEEEPGEDPDEMEVEKDATPTESLELCRKFPAASTHRSKTSVGEGWDKLTALLPRLMHGLCKDDMENRRQISLDGFFPSKRVEAEPGTPR